MNRGRLRRLTSDLVFDGSRLHAGAVLVLTGDGTIVDLLPGTADLPGEGNLPVEGDLPVEGRLPGTGEDLDADGSSTNGGSAADIEYHQGLLAPGFINAHCHLELSHMRGLLPRGSGLVDFILQLQRLRHFPKERIVSAMLQGEKEMLSEGIVAVGDIANSDISFPVKRQSHLQYHTFLELFGFDPARAESVFSRGLALQESASAMRAFSLVPHAPYSVSEDLFRLIGGHHEIRDDGPHNAGDKQPSLLSIHNQESAHEDLFFLDGTGDFTRLYREFGIDISFYRPPGRRALTAWLPWLHTSQTGAPRKTLLVHNTYTTAGDLEEALRQGEMWWCLCPGANLYIEDRLPDVPLFLEKELNMVLGTDSLASNTSLSILEEMKILSRHFPQIRLEQLLQWATRNGARLFDWDHLGSFTKGKRPGVNLITGVTDGRLGDDARVRPLVAAGRGMAGTSPAHAAAASFRDAVQGTEPEKTATETGKRNK